MDNSKSNLILINVLDQNENNNINLFTKENNN